MSLKTSLGNSGISAANAGSTAASTAASATGAVGQSADFQSMMNTYSSTEEQAMAKNIQFMVAQAGFSPMQKVSKADASS